MFFFFVKLPINTKYPTLIEHLPYIGISSLSSPACVQCTYSFHVIPTHSQIRRKLGGYLVCYSTISLTRSKVTIQVNIPACCHMIMHFLKYSACKSRGCTWNKLICGLFYIQECHDKSPAALTVQAQSCSLKGKIL